MMSDFGKKGFILLSTALFILVFIIIILPLINWSANEYSWTNRSFMAFRALNLGDAGAELAVWEIVHNDAQFTTWSGASPDWTKALNSFTDNTENTVGDIFVRCQNTSPGNYLITSTGYLPSVSNPVVKKIVKVKVFPHALFNNGIFGFNAVTLSGNTLADSYNSALGPYDPLTAGTNSDVGTNGNLTLLENALIKGDVFVGPGGAASGNDPTHLTGDTFYYGNDVELEPYELSPYFITLPSGGNLAIAGKSDVTIPSGDYRYENITLEAKAILRLSSNTRIYIHNDFYIGGQAVVYTASGVEIYIGGNGTFAGQGIVNETGAPNNLQIFGLNPSTTLSYTGLNDFYGTIYAPESTIYMAGNANVFGALVGGDVTLAGSIAFHYDEALAINGPFSGYDIAYWQED